MVKPSEKRTDRMPQEPFRFDATRSSLRFSSSPPHSYFDSTTSFCSA